MFEPCAVIVVRLDHTLRELPGGVWELLRRGVLPDDSPGCHFRRLAQNKQLRLKRPRFSWTRIKGESDVQGGGENGSVEGRGTGRGGGSPKGDRSPCRRRGGRGGLPGAGAAVERLRQILSSLPGIPLQRFPQMVHKGPVNTRFKGVKTVHPPSTIAEGGSCDRNWKPWNGRRQAGATCGTDSRMVCPVTL